MRYQAVSEEVILPEDYADRPDAAKAITAAVYRCADRLGGVGPVGIILRQNHFFGNHLITHRLAHLWHADHHQGRVVFVLNSAIDLNVDAGRPKKSTNMPR